MSNEDSSVNWGIIGCGNVTEVKSGPAYQKTPGFTLHGVTRRNLELAQDYARRHNVAKVYKTAEELVHDDDIDAVYIATPPDSHLAYGLMVAAAGKPCCIEKPLSPSYEDSAQIVRAFEARNTSLFVAYYRRTLPRFIKIKSLIDEGEIGHVRRIHWDLSAPPSEVDLAKKYNWRTDSKVARGGYFDDLASHGLDLFCYFLGEISVVSGTVSNQQNLYSAYDSVNACWVHEGGVGGTASWNFASYQSVDSVTLVGSSGEIRFSVFHDNEIVLINKDGEKRFDIDHPKHVQQGHVEAMQRALLSGHAHPSTGATALHTSWVMENILATQS